MCGILGANVEKTKEELEFCKKLMKELCIRGLHSFGICMFDNNRYKLCKTLNKQFNNYIEEFKNSDTNKFIFHNRYSTSGDFKEIANNQPILVPKVGSLAFNGVLTMMTKKEFENYYNVNCLSYNDGEIFLQKMKENVDLEDFLNQEKQCSFAGVFLMKEKLFGIRNNKRPLYYYESDNGKYIVSTLDTIKRAGGNIEHAKIIKPYERCYI